MPILILQDVHTAGSITDPKKILDKFRAIHAAGDRGYWGCHQLA